MKLFVAAFLSLIVLVSCQKEITGEIIENPSDSSQTGLTGSFKAKINGVQWSADKGYAAGFSNAGNGLPRLMNITGFSNDKKYLTITLVDSGVHKYTLSDTSWNVAAYIDSTLSNMDAFTTNQGPVGEEAGTVEITSINTVAKTISGTFSFKVYKQADRTESDITEGSFTNIPYLDGNILPPSVSTDTFAVKINDTLFTPFSISGDNISLTNNIMVQGSDSLALRNVSITFPNDILPGIYPLDDFVHIGLYNNGNVPLGSTSGSLEILEYNTTTKRIRGNFNFYAEFILNPAISAQLTAGYFSVKYR